MSVQTVTTKPKERRQSVNVSMAVVHKTNRSEDKKLERHVEHLKQKEHQDQVRHSTEVRKLEKELESMQFQVESADRTFTKRETEEQDVPYLFGSKMAAQQPRKVRRKRCRGDSAAAALDRVARNVELTGKNRFRSAVMAVCVAKGLGGGGSDAKEHVQDQAENESDVNTNDNLSDAGVQSRGSSSARGRGRVRMQTYPTDRPNTSPAKPLSRRSTGVRPASTADDLRSCGSQSSSAFRSTRSEGRRNTLSSLSSLRSADSPSPAPTVSLPDLVGAARASIVHAAESAKAATVLKRRGSAVSTVTAAERELERRRSSAALRLQEIKRDLSSRDEGLQDRIKLFVKTSMPGECTQARSARRPLAITAGGEPLSTTVNAND